MALKATIFRIELQVSDLDRNYFATHALTLARHPSETDERMMVRVLAFALNAHERLEFGRGLSAEDEADLVLTDLTGSIELWVEVGLTDERELRRACGRARQVICYTYGRGAAVWRADNREALARLSNLKVVELPAEFTLALAKLAARTMSMGITLQEGQLWIDAGAEHLHFILPSALGSEQ